MPSDLPPWRWNAAQLRRALQQAQEHLPAVLDPYAAALPRPARPAAVLVPFVPGPTGWQILFIQRAQQPHDPHSGQVSFPGGRQEEDDVDPRATALRETFEEVGLRPTAVQIWAPLPYHRTASNYCVRPWVGQILSWPQPLRLQRSEVARVFTVPLAWLADWRHLERRWRRVGTALVPTYYYHWPMAEIWGATARMVVTLLHALGLAQTRPLQTHWHTGPAKARPKPPV